MIELTEQQQLVARTVRNFVEGDVMPVASEMEHRDEYPHALVENMKTLGLFGLNVPEEYGGSDVDYTTIALVFEGLRPATPHVRKSYRGASNDAWRITKSFWLRTTKISIGRGGLGASTGVGRAGLS